MSSVRDQVAFITGAASGIGYALTARCLDQGMRVMLADLDVQSLDRAAAALGGKGELATVACDVASIETLEQARQQTIDCFGSVHWLVNNAGVLCEGNVGEMPVERWRWAVDVNILGVVYGTETFLPELRKNPATARILNTASVGGHIGFAGMPAYCATKHAVVGFSEALREQLAAEGISVSTLCPGFVRTQITRTDRYAEGGAENPAVAEAVERGMAPEVVAEFAFEETLARQPYIFTHPGTRGEVLERVATIETAFDRSEASATIQSDPDARRQASRQATEDLHQ